MRYTNLGMSDFARAERLFTEKKWDIDDKYEGSLYNRFLQMLDCLDIHERELIYELTRKLIVVDVEKYRKKIFKVMRDVIIHKGSFAAKSFYVMPALEKEVADDGEEMRTVVKSGSFVAYLLKNINHSYDEYLSKKKVCIVASLSDLTTKRINQINNSMIVIPDDYIGKGEQVEGLINRLLEKGVKKEKIIVAVLYIMREGYERLRKMKVDCYYDEILDKAFDETQEGIRKKVLLKQISNKFGIDDDIYLGRDESQALIVLNRVPNNTIAVFRDSGKGMTKRMAMFPRD